jgi:O-antigen/teichoic acid export membrane protein
VPTESVSPTSTAGSKSHPPVLGRLLRGTFWLALKTPLQVIIAFWSIPLIQHHIGDRLNGAYVAAWGFAFLQFLLEFGMSSALQRQVSDAWTRGDRDGVDRAIACGTSFYAVMSVVQSLILIAIAHYADTLTGYRGEARLLFVRLLWLQAVVAPCFGLSMVATGVLQAARRYEFVPKLELIVVVLRFAILWVGLKMGVSFFVIVATQTVTQIILLLAPALWVMGKELGHAPHFRGASLADWKALGHIGSYMALIQLSVVLADKIDTTILSFVLVDPGPATTIYQNVSKGFLQIRQTGWMLTSLVMPAVASLAAARDERGMERVKYDGARLLAGILVPVTLLAAIYARPFLMLWVGPRFGQYAPLMRLFLIGTLPLLISVHVQMAIGLKRIEVIAVSALVGSLVNLLLSYYLTWRWQSVDGVIWGTVVTTLFSNLLVPGVYVFRILDMNVPMFLRRALGAPTAGAVALAVASWFLGQVFSSDPAAASGLGKYLPFVIHLTAGCLAYGVGYMTTSSGRADLAALVRRVLRRPASTVI